MPFKNNLIRLLVPLVLLAFYCPFLQSANVVNTLTPAMNLTKNKTITIAWTKPDHAKGTHNYQGFADSFKQQCEQIEGLKVQTIEGFPKEEAWKKSDLVILFMTNRKHTQEMNAIVSRHIERGGAVMVLHQALVVYKGGYKGWADNLGYSYQLIEKRTSKYGKMDLTLNVDNAHEVTKSLPETIKTSDELYWELAKGNKGRTTILASCKITNDNKTNWPVFWVTEHGKKQEQGRVFVSVLGHYAKLFEQPFFHNTLLRATAWTLREDFDAFIPLVKADKK